MTRLSGLIFCTSVQRHNRGFIVQNVVLWLLIKLNEMYRKLPYEQKYQFLCKLDLLRNIVYQLQEKEKRETSLKRLLQDYVNLLFKSVVMVILNSPKV